MRSIKRFFVITALLSLLGCISMYCLPDPLPIEVQRDISETEYAILKVPDGLYDDTSPVYFFEGQQNTFPIDSVLTHYDRETNEPTLQIVYSQKQELIWDQYLFIQNLKYRQDYCDFKHKWVKSEYNKHYMRAKVALTEYEFRRRGSIYAEWMYYNSYLFEHGHSEIELTDFVINVKGITYEDYQQYEGDYQDPGWPLSMSEMGLITIATIILMALLWVFVFNRRRKSTQ